MDIGKFVIEEVINVSETQKRVSLWGHIQGKDKSVKGLLMVEPVADPTGESISQINNLQLTFHNDIYNNFQCTMPATHIIKATYPATMKHYNKYVKKQQLLRYESGKEYEDNQQKIKEEVKHNQWVYNILQSKAEADRVLYKEEGVEGFMVLPDSNFTDKDNMAQLHLLVIVNDRKLYTLRELRSKHVPMLRKMEAVVREIMEREYSCKHFRSFLHYPPTFYHLHIHFTSLEQKQTTSSVERCHDLRQVIRNLELSDTYYRDAELNYLYDAPL